jgi:general secretion pathway protein F
MSLSRALDNQGGVFSRFYVNMIRAGEAGGSLPGVLLRLAEYMERAKALRDNVTASMTYPHSSHRLAHRRGRAPRAVVPRFKPIFASAGKAIPLATRSCFGRGTCCATGAGSCSSASGSPHTSSCAGCQDPNARYRFDRWLVTGPVIGDLFAKVEMARFSRTLGTLLANGVTLVSALNIVRDTMGNSWLAEASPASVAS